LTIDQPPQLGKVSEVAVSHPASAAGNIGFLAVAGHLAGTTPFPVPGWTTIGALRVDPGQLHLQLPWTPVIGGGVASLPIPVPNDPSIVGVAVDLQSIDLDPLTGTLFWSDNDLELVLGDTGCGVTPAVSPLYPVGSPQEPDVVVDTPTAMITYLSDRVRDRHARESQFQLYDHWLPFYWEQRIAELTIIDEVAKGGAAVRFRFMTHDQLNPAEFRAFFAAPAAVYHHNLSNSPGTGVTFLSSAPSTRYPGETEYTYEAVLTTAFPQQQPLAIGDKIEVELSQFLLAPRNGRHNYYGTAFLYVVGEGVVPWYAKEIEEQQPNPTFDSYRLPDLAWLGGATTLPYQYSNEPLHRFKQTAGNISHASGHEFVIGRRLHHTDFGTGAHSEPGNPPMTAHAGQLGPKFIAASCVSCHIGNGRSLPAQVGNPLQGSVVRVGSDAQGVPHPVLGDTFQPSVGGAGGSGSLSVQIEAESYAVASGVTTEPTLDVGGGSNVTSIDTGDWMSYYTQPVNVPTSDTYVVSFRVASDVSTGLLAFEQNGGAVIHAVVSVPDTGGMQTWQTVTANVFLAAGSHVFGLNANSGGFNLNWFKIESPPSGPGPVGPTSEGQIDLAGYSLVNGTYGDGTPFQLARPVYGFSGTTAPAFFSVRNAPPMIGLGLLEALDDATIFARHDPCDSDGNGISGRVSTTTQFGSNQTVLGRFGWKGTRGSVRDQIARALNRDMGVATAEQPVFDGESTVNPTEIDAVELDRMTRYVALLGVGARRDLTDPGALNGEQLFSSIGCADCHVSQMTTGSTHPYGELRNQVIRPFTDLLLHDMGPGLADNMGDGDATGSEWRTAPLWNIGLTAGVAGGEAYLHDGRAQTLEEAILWHGGEGEAAKEAFRTLPALDRADLIKFLRSL